MIPILLNARVVATGDGYIAKLSLEFCGNGSKRKHCTIPLQPGMTRDEVATSLRKAADDINAATH